MQGESRVCVFLVVVVIIQSAGGPRDRDDGIAVATRGDLASTDIDRGTTTAS